MNNEKTEKRQSYIDYFKHMEEEHRKIPLGGMAWDDVNYHAHEAVNEKGLFTEEELRELFPYLF